MSAMFFQTRFGSSAYHCVLVLLLMREIFVAYETTTSILTFSTDRATNRSLKRELCYVEVQGILMFFQINILCCRTRMEFGDFKESQTQKASSYWVLLLDMKAVNNKQCS